MSIEVPPSLKQDSDKESLIVPASYFVVRVLRNATRGYQNPVVSTEPPEDVRNLAEQAIREIEDHEGMSIQDLPTDRIQEYRVLLREFASETYQRSVGHDSERTERLLSEIRSTRPTD
jgi:hypothetical protein